MWSKNDIAKAAKELADHLQVIENIKALQTGQKELADALKAMNERLSELQAEIRALKAETIKESLKETSMIVNAVQGGFNQRVEDLSVRLALAERDIANSERNNRGATSSVNQSTRKQIDHPDA